MKVLPFANVLLIGGGGSGKTSFIKAAKSGSFAGASQPTNGFELTGMEVDGVYLNLWELAANSFSLGFTRDLARQAHIVVGFLEEGNAGSEAGTIQAIEKLLSMNPTASVWMLVQSKSDLERCEPKLAENLAEKYAMSARKASALDGLACRELLKECLDSLRENLGI